MENEYQCIIINRILRKEKGEAGSKGHPTRDNILARWVAMGELGCGMVNNVILPGQVYSEAVRSNVCNSVVNSSEFEIERQAKKATKLCAEENHETYVGSRRWRVRWRSGQLELQGSIELGSRNGEMRHSVTSVWSGARALLRQSYRIGRRFFSIWCQLQGLPQLNGELFLLCVCLPGKYHLHTRSFRSSLRADEPCEERFRCKRKETRVIALYRLGRECMRNGTSE